MGKYTAKLEILLYDNFDEKHSPLQRNGMTAIPKRRAGKWRINKFNQRLLKKENLGKNKTGLRPVSRTALELISSMLMLFYLDALQSIHLW